VEAKTAASQTAITPRPNQPQRLAKTIAAVTAKAMWSEGNLL
jgi:hypothetical protein